MAALQAPVDAFFDGVMVNVDDLALRRNRLALLAKLRQQFLRPLAAGRLARLFAQFKAEGSGLARQAKTPGVELAESVKR